MENSFFKAVHQGLDSTQSQVKTENLNILKMETKTLDCNQNKPFP